jgi:uncharacterized membrane protein YfcA
MPQVLLALAVGFAAGVLSGAFGVGGGVVTTPAIRLLLGEPALIAVGTPLPVIIPTAIVGSISYARRGLADVRAGVVIGLWGAAASVLGAYLSDLAGGSVVMMATAVLILYLAIDMLTHGGKQRTDRLEGAAPGRGRSWGKPVLGIVTGLYSGFLGLGGGFILVPMLVRFGGYPIKKAIGTSLTVIAILAIPGSITHWSLGHVNVELALLLALGVIPGVLIGAKLTSVASERWVRYGFSALLLFVGVVLAINEIRVIVA